MTIFYDNTLSTKRLPKSHTLLFDPHVSPSKLNIKLKTHSLTCLNIPLETFVGFKEISQSLQNDHQKTMAGSIDLISEIQQQPNEENLSRFSTTQPLINMASSNQQLPSGQQQWRQILRQRFHVSSSFITPTSLNDSVARLRRSRHLRNIHQSSLQAIDKLSERKRRLSFSHNGPIPKFTLRNLPSSSRSSSSSFQQFEQSSKLQMSPYISLPEIRSFSEQNSLDNSKKIKNKPKVSPLPTASSWEKSSSWSWKSNDAVRYNSDKYERIKPNIINKEIQRQMEDQMRSNLPVIIESPLQQRSSLQTINRNDQHFSTKSNNMYRSNLSFHSDQIEQNSYRLYQKKTFFPHSISNYDVTPNAFSRQPTTRYPSTPLLSYSRDKNIDKFDCHPLQLHILPLATFDADADDDSDSISSDSSFRSCLNSNTEYSEDNITEVSSSIAESCFQELSSSYDLPREIFQETIKHTRFSFRHLCTLQ